MNERIRELAKQSYKEVIETNDYNGSAYTAREFDQEKFAELIIKECINKIETYRIPVGNSAAGEMACEWTYDALIEIRDDIKDHFGVE